MSTRALQSDAASPFLTHLDESIRSARFWTVALPLRHRLHHAKTDVAALTSVLVEIELEDGARGWGEVRTNGAYATGEDETVVVGALQAMPLAGRRVGDVVDELSGRSRLAVMAVDVAVWDALARRLDLPLYRAWNGRSNSTESVRTHGQIGFGDVAAGRELAAGFVSAGLDRLKVRVGSPELDTDLDRLRGIRDLVGPDVRLIVDANGAWTYDTAATAIDALADIGVDWLEQPVMSIDDMSRLRRNAGVQIYADESVRDVTSVEKISAAAAVDGVHLKLEKAGTVGQLLQTVERARSMGIEATIGQMDQGRLGCAVTTHLAAALGLDRAELWGWANISRDTNDELTIRDGCVRLPDGAGNGISTIDIAFAQEFS